MFPASFIGMLKTTKIYRAETMESDFPENIDYIINLY